MKADEVRQFKKALSIDEVPAPEVGGGRADHAERRARAFA
jgi:hypothetical protein